MEFLIITGLSGAGKTVALNFFEDKGYFCVDNLPPALLTKFAELCRHSELKKIAIVIDIRGEKFFDAFFKQITYLKEHDISYEIIFLEASDKTLISRFKESRRPHPLGDEGRMYDAIQKERFLLEELKGKASRIINTSELGIDKFYQELEKIYDFQQDEHRNMSISIVSFGFKYGAPMDSDLVFDVRFLPNPYYVEALKNKTGQEKEVKKYVLKWPVTQAFYDKLFSFIKFLLPEYKKEGKSHLGIAIGCTGGKHRSVVTANSLKNELMNLDYRVVVEHRDINE